MATIAEKNGSTRQLALVTGASSGIGFELAKQFATNGFDLIIVSSSNNINAAAAELRTFGATVQPFTADLREFGEIERFIGEVEKLGRPVDAAALNAGVGIYGDFIREQKLEDALDLIQLNVVAVVHLAKRIGRWMAQRGEGRILFTSSVAATAPGPLYAVYAASKAFVQSFAEALRNELKESGVTVTALQPGATDTNFFNRAGMQDTKVAHAEKDDPAQVAEQGFKALMSDEDHVVGGAFKNKVQVASSRVMPEPAKAAQQRKQLEPDPKH